MTLAGCCHHGGVVYQSCMAHTNGRRHVTVPGECEESYRACELGPVARSSVPPAADGPGRCGPPPPETPNLPELMPSFPPAPLGTVDTYPDTTR